MNLPEDYISLIQNEYNESMLNPSFIHYTKAYSIDELYNHAAKINTQNTQIRDEILKFNINFPDSYISLDKFGLTEKDIHSYYMCKTTRSVYHLSQLRCFSLDRFDKYLSDKIFNGKCKHPILFLLALITLAWIICVILLSPPQIGFWSAIAIPFCAVSVASCLWLCAYITLYIVTEIYNFRIKVKCENEDIKYYANDSLTKKVINLLKLQHQYFRSLIMIPLPRICIKYLKKELKNGFNGIPSNVSTEDVAKEVLAIANGSLYRNGLFSPRYYAKVNSIDRMTVINPYIAKAIIILGISEEQWIKISRDIIFIGVIRGASRNHADYREEYDINMRKEMLISYDEVLIDALRHFNIPVEEWIEIGEDVLIRHKVYDRDDLMTHGYISEAVNKYRFMELL